MATLSTSFRSTESYKQSLTSATQGEGDQTIDTSESTKDEQARVLDQWQIQFEPNGGTTGTLEVLGKTPGAPSFAPLGGSFDMSKIGVLEVSGSYEAIKVSPSSFDGTDYAVYLFARKG